MEEPQKPFACGMPNCGMTFTNEDHLHVHTKKHDMVLHLGMEQKAAFVADQTPTPTRFIRNCEEVGLFQDLQNVNPFDEGFKRAIENKAGHLLLEAAAGAGGSDDVLHTPQMVFPLPDGDSALYTSNNQRNITISRSSSDESGTVKEYETTTISKLTNEVTTISRKKGSQDILDKITTTDDVSIVRHEDVQNKEINETVSYTNNVIKIHSNVEITSKMPGSRISYTDSVTKDVLLTDGNRLQVPEKFPPVMTQKSLDYVVDSLDQSNNQAEVRDKDYHVIKMLKRNYQHVKKPDSKESSSKHIELDEFEVIIKKPDGRQVRMKPVLEVEQNKVQEETKEKLKRVLSEKADKKESLNMPTSSSETAVVHNIVPIAGTLVPVTIVNPNTILLTNNLQKVPIVPFNVNKFKPSQNYKKTVKRRLDSGLVTVKSEKKDEDAASKQACDKDRAKELEPRTAASRRYRQKQKLTMYKQAEENRHLKEKNQKLMTENAHLKMLITEHLKKCTDSDDLRTIQMNLQTES